MCAYTINLDKRNLKSQLCYVCFKKLNWTICAFKWLLCTFLRLPIVKIPKTGSNAKRALFILVNAFDKNDNEMTYYS